MRRLTLTLVALATLASYAQAGIPKVAGGNNNNNTQNGEQMGPFGFPGQKTMGEKLKLTQEQETALVVIYSKYRKLEHQIQQAAANKKTDTNANNAGSGIPDAGTCKGNMIMEIRMILVTEDQKKTFQGIVDDLGKKKKKT
jgi:hypothetical protein